MKIKIKQIRKVFDNCLNYIDTEWENTHILLPSVSDVIKILKDQMNINFIDMESSWDDDILEFNSEEDYFLFLIRFS